MTDKMLNRYKGDQLAQQLWAIKQGLVKPRNIYAPQKPYKPAKFKVYGAHAAQHPVVLAYELWIDFWHEVGYQGESVIITTKQWGDIPTVFANEGMMFEYSEYMSSVMCPSDCWLHDEHNGVMRPSAYARNKPNHAVFTATSYNIVMNWLQRKEVVLA